MCVPNQTPARAGGQFGERRPDLSHSGRASEYLENLTQIVTAFIVVGGLQRGQLPDTVGVAEQGLVIEAPGLATGQEVAHLRSCRCQVPAPPKRVGRREDSPQQHEQQDNSRDRHEAVEQIGFGVIGARPDRRSGIC